MIAFHLEKTVNGATGPLLLSMEGRIGTGEAVALYGVSGCGKTTLLRMLAGLTRPDRGMIEVDQEVWFDSSRGIDLPVQKRRVGMVFQDQALFPHLTVRQNLSYAHAKGQPPRAVDDLIDMMELQALADRRPETLSGGQKQRVALARALARNPVLLLLDEPLSALDAGMRRKLQEELVRVHRELAVTTLLVSHDPGEIVRTTSRVLCLENGRIARDAPPLEVFSGGKFSGKFRFQAEVLALEDADDVMVVASLLVGMEVVRVVILPEEAVVLSPGDRVTVASKAFNPVLWKENP